MRLSKPIKTFLIVVGAIGTIACVTLYHVVLGPNYFPEERKEFFVSKGQIFSQVVDSLETQGVIRNREFFIFVSKLYGGASKIRVGKYSFESGVSNRDIYLSLREGVGIVPITVTIPEGIVARTQAHILARKIGIDSARYVALVHDGALAHTLGVTGPSLEGYLYPDTYLFFWQADEKEVIKKLVEQFQHFYDDSLRATANAMGWTTNEVVTLASIIEGEAVLDSERKIISGVYHNRLGKGMRLQADPTVQYILEDGPRRVRYSDLKIQSPYNTYRNKGLPPGPVNNPRGASILAALYPQKNGYLYFVANGVGGHWFSSSYDEHMRYVRKYRRDRARREAISEGQTRKRPQLNN